MSLRVTLSSKDVGATIRGSRGALAAVTRGVDPAIAAAVQYVRIIKVLLSVPGQGIERGGHRASAPGDPPAPDTGVLRAGVGFTVLGPTRVGVGIGGPRAQPTSAGRPVWEILERGGRFIKPRPFVRPAIAIGKSEATDAALSVLRQRIRTVQRLRGQR